MSIRNRAWCMLAVGLGCLAAAVVEAQWAVVDVGAIGQLVREVEEMEQQLSVAQNHLHQAEQQYASMTGSRGLEQLLADAPRNYLPPDWAQFSADVDQVSTRYHALAEGIAQLLQLNAVLTPDRIARLSKAERYQLEAHRTEAAELEMTTRTALITTSERFDALQRLINAIPTAHDQKGALELQARIGAEQAMLTNEQTKLQLLYQAAQAEELAHGQQMREQAIHDIGSLRDLPPMGLPIIH